VQDDGVNMVLAAPEEHSFHEEARQSAATKAVVRVNVEYVAASRALTNHVWRPIHKPKPGARGYGAIRGGDHPGAILSRLHTFQ
jgi:hypothetical protein